MTTETVHTTQAPETHTAEPVRIRAHHRTVTKLGHWTTGRCFDIAASRGTVVLRLPDITDSAASAEAASRTGPARAPPVLARSSCVASYAPPRFGYTAAGSRSCHCCFPADPRQAHRDGRFKQCQSQEAEQRTSRGAEVRPDRPAPLDSLS